MKLNDVIKEQTRIYQHKDKNKLWQDILSEYFLKISNLNNWIVFERKRLLNRYPDLYCPLPKHIVP